MYNMWHIKYIFEILKLEYICVCDNLPSLVLWKWENTEQNKFHLNIHMQKLALAPSLWNKKKKKSMKIKKTLMNDSDCRGSSL